MARRKPAAARSAAASSVKQTNPSAIKAPATPLPTWQWWLLAAAVPIYLLASRLTLDFWADEVYTIYDFAAQPVARIVTDYSAPNNHILYSLVLHPLAVVTQREIWLRLPSFLFAVATLAIIFRLVHRLAGLSAAVAGTLALGLNVMFLTHAVQVRGYSLSMLLAAWLMDLAAPRAQPARLAKLLSITLAGAAFLYVMPSNAIFLAPLAVAAVVLAWRLATPLAESRRRPIPWSVVISWFAAWPLALAAYLPILKQVRAAAGGAGGPLDWSSLMELIRDVYWAAGHDLLPLLIALPVVVYRLLRTRSVPSTPANKEKETATPPAITLLALMTAMLIAPLMACWLLGSTPFVRNFCPLLPTLAVGVGWFAGILLGDNAAITGKADPRGALPWVALVLVFAVMLPPVLRYPGRLDAVRSQRFAQDGYYNYYAADFEPSRVARYLGSKIRPDEDFLVLYADGDQYNLAHYLQLAGIPIPPKRLTETSPGKARAKIFCVVPEFAQWDELAKIAGVGVEQLRKYPLVERAGYFRIYASPEPVEISIPGSISR